MRPRLFDVLARRWDSLRKQDVLDAAMDDEMRFHIEHLIAQKQREGLDCKSARAAALREFGNPAVLEEECRDERRTRWVSNFWRDIRFGARGLRRNPVFFWTAMLSLSLGIGGSAAVFAILDAVLLQSLPGVANPGQLVALDGRAQQMDVGIAFGDFLEIRKAASRSLLGSYATSGRYHVRLTTGGRHIDRINAAEVTHEFFDVLGLRPALGRTFASEEDAVPDSALKTGSVVVIGHALWQREFGGDPKAVGQTLLLNQASCRIVGIAPPRFTGDATGEPVEVWMPLRPFRSAELLSAVSGGYYVKYMARLRPGATESQAATELTSAYRQLQSTRPPVKFFTRQQNSAGWTSIETKASDYRVILEPGRAGFDILREPFEKPLYLMLGATMLVFLIGCANVANLLLSRGVARKHELSVRRALGAGRSRIAMQILTECLLLASAASIAGLAMARWGSTVLVGLVNPGETLDLAVMGWRVGAFLAALTLLSVLVFGLIPAWRQSNEGELNVRGTGRGGQRTSRALIVAQVALSVLLLSAASLLAQTIRNLRLQDFGFQPQGVVALSYSLNSRDNSPQHARQVAERLLNRAENLPGVQSASLSSSGFFSGRDMFNTLDLPGMNPGDRVGSRVDYVSPRYFETMGVQLREGRAFHSTEDVPVAVANEAFVRKVLNGKPPLGVEFGIGKKRFRIVGVVRDARYRNAKIDYEPSLFLPHTQSSQAPRRLEIRTANPPALMPVLRAAVREVEPDAVIKSIHRMDEDIDTSFHRELVLAKLAAAFSGLALLLSAIGIYGMMSYAISRRVNEFGLRMALGARPGQVFALVMRDGATLLAVGLAAGIPAAWAACRLLESYLFGVQPGDTATYVAASFVIATATFLAAWFPARRAAHVDPAIALRAG